MDRKLIIGIAVVAVIAIAAVTIVSGLGNHDDKKVIPDKGALTNLTVLGNADLDDDIDDDDVKAIEYIISINGTVADYPYADANNDQAIDQKDIDVAFSIINCLLNQTTNSIKICSHF